MNAARNQSYVSHFLAIDFSGDLRIKPMQLHNNTEQMIVTFSPADECLVFPANFMAVVEYPVCKCVAFELVSTDNVLLSVGDYESHLNDNKNQILIRIGDQYSGLVTGTSARLSTAVLKESCPPSPNLCLLEMHFELERAEGLTCIAQYEKQPLELIEGLAYKQAEGKLFLYYLPSGAEALLYLVSEGTGAIDYNLRPFALAQDFPAAGRGDFGIPMKEGPQLARINSS